ncbi:MAG: hypothetical protein AB7U46_13270 [Paenirhodobacter sp.]|uniref:hypothetical protein n=1 Tax=Paenirhodobacter sp. TaxID=1965326 RepID=UPI003D105F61
MRPSFALNLSHDGIGLFARAGTGWELLGEVALDAPDFAEQLGALRSEALARSPEGLATKVIIPASQILYTEVDAPGPRPVMRRRQIATALDGMTPYDVADLVFDWTGRDDRVQVAVVARETLDEAESFAEDWGFAPVGFVGVPEPGDYAGEPWFGAAKAARDHLPEGEKVERDPRPIAAAMISAVRAARDGVAEAAPVTEAEAAEEAAPEDGPLNDAVPEFAEAEDLAPEGAEITADPAEPLPVPESDAAAEIAETPEAPAFDAEEAADLAAALDTESAAPAEPEASPEPEHAPEPLPEAPAFGAELPLEIPGAPAAETVDDSFEAELAAELEPAAEPVTEEPVAFAPEEEEALAEALGAEIAPELMPEAEAEAPVAETYDIGAEVELEAPSEAPPEPVAPVLAPEEIAEDPEGAEEALAAALGDEITPETLVAAAELPLFAAPEPAGTAPELVPELAVEEAPFTEVTDEDPTSEDTLVPAPAFASRRDAMLAARQPSAEGPAKPLGGAARLHPAGAPERKALFARAGEAGVTAPGLALPAEPAAAPEAETDKPRRGLGRAARGTVALGGSAGKALAQGLRPRVTAKPAKAPEPAAPDEKTVFGARKKTQVGGKPKYLGAALIGGLIAFLAIVALWSSFLGGDETPAPAPVEQAEAPAAETTAAPGAALQDAPQMTLAEAQAQAQAAAEAQAPAEATPEATAPEAAAPEVVAPEETPAAAAPEGTLSSQSAPAEAAPEAPVASEAETQVPAPSLPNPQLALPPGVALPPAESLTDTPPVTPSAPPPFDDLARVDPQGSYEPTPEGVVTPGGFTLYAGKPGRVPRARPDTVIAKAEKATAAAEAAAEEAANPAPYADPALKRFRPKLRPAAIDRAAAAAATAPATPEAAPAAPAAPQDDGALLAPGLSPAEAKRLAARRPNARPDAVLTLAAAAVPPVEVETADPFADATAQAVDVSRRPVSRPRNFKASVDRALAAAVAAEAAAAPTQVAAAAPAPAPTPAPAPKVAAAAPAPAVELDEPEPTKAAPKLPTTASVAKQATEKNALNLNEMNLIGIYGASRDRRALIRMPNGRFVKVSVGDRLDGGKVTAIGDSQLTYQKGSRSYVLKLLKNG